MQGGYHDAFTHNVNAIVEVTELLNKAAQGRDGLDFLPQPLKSSARAASKRSNAGLLDTQLVIGGRKTPWARPYGALTMAPASTRNYEPVALCTLESAAVLNYLMTLPSPTSDVVAAIEDGVAMLRTQSIEGKAWRKVGELEGRRLVSAPVAPTV